MTKEQFRLAASDAALFVLWVLMNVAWMWEWYTGAIAIALPTAAAAVAVVWFSERKVPPMLLAGAGAAWFLKDFVWMLENGGMLASGKIWGTAFALVSIASVIAALTIAAGNDSLADVAERIKRVRLLIVRK